MNAVVAADEVWNEQVTTADLNRWLAVVQGRHPPPLVVGRRLRLRYVTQVDTGPPSFVRCSPRNRESSPFPIGATSSTRCTRISTCPAPDPDDAAQGQEPYDAR